MDEVDRDLWKSAGPSGDAYSRWPRANALSLS